MEIQGQEQEDTCFLCLGEGTKSDPLVKPDRCICKNGGGLYHNTCMVDNFEQNYGQHPFIYKCACSKYILITDRIIQYARYSISLSFRVNIWVSSIFTIIVISIFLYFIINVLMNMLYNLSSKFLMEAIILIVLVFYLHSFIFNVLISPLSLFLMNEKTLRWSRKFHYHCMLIIIIIMVFLLFFFFLIV